MADLRFSSGDKFWGPITSAFSFKSPKTQFPMLCCHSGGGKDSEGSQAAPDCFESSGVQVLVPAGRVSNQSLAGGSKNSDDHEFAPIEH